ncbi:unnamed protein product [Calypogeia fissa]
MLQVKCKIQSFFIHGFDSHYQLFFTGIWYNQVLADEEDDGKKVLFKTESTDMNLIFNEPLSKRHGRCTYPVSKILHRFMLHPTKMQRRDFNFNSRETIGS